MVDWTLSVVSAGSVVVGSLLAYGQQALTDRRIARRERDSRRENFKIQNFEVHKNALLEIQQLLSEFSGKTWSENIWRREVEREFFNRGTWEKLMNGAEEVKEDRERLSQYAEKLQKAPDAETWKELEQESKNLVDAASSWSELYLETMNEFRDILNRRTNYMLSLGEFIEKLRLGMYRSGSNAVVAAGEDYVNSLLKWTNHTLTMDADELMSRVRASEFALHRAISNALTKGPFDGYKHDMQFGEEDK